MSFSFNKSGILALESEGSRKQYRDKGSPESVQGLLVEVQSSGEKIFRLRRKLNGKNHNIKIGRFPDLSVEKARKRAKELNALIESGKDPNEDKRVARDAMTLDEVFSIYQKEFEYEILKGNREQGSLGNYETLYRLHIQPKMGAMNITYITKRTVQRFLEKTLADKGYSLHNHSLTLLKSMYTRAGLSQEIFQGLTKVDESLHRRERVLSESEFEEFFWSVEQEKPIYRDCVGVLCFTAQRKALVLGMKWSEINFETATWHIHATRTKNKKAQVVPLVPVVMEILERRYKESSSDETFVFPSKRSASGHITDKSGKGGFWHRITSRIGMYCVGEPKHLTIHDLRRSIATLLTNNGVPLQTISRMLSHSSIQVTNDVYAHISTETVRDGLKIAEKSVMQSSQEVGSLSNLDVALKAIEKLNNDERLQVLASMMK